MEDFILDILARIRELERALAANELEDIVRAHNQGIRENKSHISKRRALPFFLKVRESDPQRWSSWNISPNEDALLLQTLRMKPRRTASGRRHHYRHNQAMALLGRVHLLSQRRAHAEKLFAQRARMSARRTQLLRPLPSGVIAPSRAREHGACD